MQQAPQGAPWANGVQIQTYVVVCRMPRDLFGLFAISVTHMPAACCLDSLQVLASAAAGSQSCCCLRNWVHKRQHGPAGWHICHINNLSFIPCLAHAVRGSPGSCCLLCWPHESQHGPGFYFNRHVSDSQASCTVFAPVVCRSHIVSLRPACFHAASAVRGGKGRCCLLSRHHTRYPKQTSSYTPFWQPLVVPALLSPLQLEVAEAAAAYSAGLTKGSMGQPA
jgi:hypothetical protein